MSYSIETRTVTEFVTDTNIRLPRFQRKAAWTPDKNFELAISMFKEYPLGVIVINDEQGKLWLLDGRQRRNALKELRDNPDLVYDAAKKYLKFRSHESEDMLKEIFWQKINAYLVSFNDEEGRSDEESVVTDEDIEADINRDRQKEGLGILLDIILMVHQKQRDQASGLYYGKWERLFKLDSYLMGLPYAPKRDNYHINPEQLHKYLLAIGEKAAKETADLTSDYFIEFVEENIKEGMAADFRTYVESHWNDMSHVINVILRAEDIFRKARIGVISIKNVTPLDAQNIFTAINTGGTKLEHVETISAKPFWNMPVPECRSEVECLVKSLYKALDVTALSGGTVVRWDVAATLMGRIRDHRLFFRNYTVDNDQNLKTVGLGFQLLSSWFENGASKVHIDSMERNPNIVWPDSIDDFVVDFNRMVDVLLYDDFFKRILLWQRPMLDMFGASATLAFCIIMLNNWKELGEPMHPGAIRNNFYRNARGLYDRFMFMYATGYWKGSGDSKMSAIIKQPAKYFTPLDENAWMTLLEGLCTDGAYTGQKIARKNLEPLLYYQLVIRGVHCTFQVESYEIDHIIPQAVLEQNSAMPDWFKDSIVNLSVLPNKDNMAKRDKKLSQLSGTLANIVSEFIGIPESEFGKYSVPNGWSDLITMRKELWIDTFGQKRNNVLNA